MDLCSFRVPENPLLLRLERIYLRASKPMILRIEFFLPRGGLFFIVWIFLFSFSFCKSVSEVDRTFNSSGKKGTLIISSLDGSKEWIHDQRRSEERFLPASTFKIPNTLIALQEKIVSDENFEFRWNGTRTDVEDWNQDQTLKSAFQRSCVWCYQELAVEVGLKKYETYLQKMEYGNLKTGKDVRTFWLEGDLRISAREQIDFLKKLYLRKFAFDSKNYEILRKIFLVGSGSDSSFFAKTGWAQSVPSIGWYVGYLETKTEVWFFALNLDVGEKKDLALRKEIVLQSFKDLGLISEASPKF
ncbi:class D beta-lactamase [Leptospira stimsonii]|uniref:Beta-lactamase n=1 Tax=Leptospira stimsonii TaxID=2202203 RepID=A0ABY2MUX1_9LEPT|nr:class D beta-lactamase [Leptospira stimsonii]TGK25234.1 class D beta-lactamase [Leptospira stimsonii]TGM08653.1 class D beta-lactamase [Leptospira stimsonii]